MKIIIIIGLLIIISILTGCYSEAEMKAITDEKQKLVNAGCYEATYQPKEECCMLAHDMGCDNFKYKYVNGGWVQIQ